MSEYNDDQNKSAVDKGKESSKRTESSSLKAKGGKNHDAQGKSHDYFHHFHRGARSLHRDAHTLKDLGREKKDKEHEAAHQIGRSFANIDGHQGDLNHPKAPGGGGGLPTLDPLQQAFQQFLQMCLHWIKDFFGIPEMGENVAGQAGKAAQGAMQGQPGQELSSTSQQNGTDAFGNNMGTLHGGSLTAEQRQRILAYCQDFVDRGVPYVWGGENPNGADCSGMTMLAMRDAGISVPHYSGAQFEYTQATDWDHMDPGDYIFYGAGGCQHVAIFAGYQGDTPMMYEEQQTGRPALLSPVREGYSLRKYV